jgi:uncharacterized protein YbjT (DUF2867 family)
MTTTVLVAGATGMLGGRIATELIDQLDVDVRLMLRASALGNTAKTRAVDALVSDGAVVALGDVTDPDSLDKATAGVDVVVSALQGGPRRHHRRSDRAGRGGSAQPRSPVRFLRLRNRPV